MKRSKTNKLFILTLSVIASASMLLSGCGSSDTTAPTASSSPAGTSEIAGSVLVTGSTSVQPLAQDLADLFADVAAEVEVDVQGGGSTQGVKDASTEVADIGMASRDLTEEEKTLGLTEHIIAFDGIAIVVHPSNQISNITAEQATAIFKGEIKNWKEVGGADQEILVVTRESGSGTRGALEELLKLQEKKDGKTYSLIAADALVADGSGAITANVSSHENAIGYTSLGYVNETIKAISIDGVECTSENVKSKAYLVSRPLLMLTKGEVSPQTQAYIDYVLSEAGQELVSEKYVSVK